MSHWDDWENDKTWEDTVTLNCEDCGFAGDVGVVCEGTGVRWSALATCPECGVEQWKGSS
jgi:predicted RNA-binding Zn-ribbon protein involved in translation (DUF1610 family)